MVVLFAFIVVSIFLMGLYQWALGGANLWRIFTIKRREQDLTREEKRQAEREVKELERAADRTISASLRIIMILMIFVWLFLGVTMILELFGINWVSSLSSRAKNYWAQPGVESQQSTPNRNDMLRNMGNNLRR